MAKVLHAELSVYLCYLLRHHPEELNLNMDKHGYVSISELISKLNDSNYPSIDETVINEIVSTDNKGRYVVKDGKIKCCQGHSIPWIEPELTYKEPPTMLYHGTTEEAYQLIMQSGHIDKMCRQAVHCQSNQKAAWASALRWKANVAIVIEINASKMYEDGYKFGEAENGVWYIDEVPTKYINQIFKKAKKQTRRAI